MQTTRFLNSEEFETSNYVTQRREVAKFRGRSTLLYHLLLLVGRFTIIL
jgi:hypothetical protein